MSIYMQIKNTIIQKYPEVIENYSEYINSNGNNTIYRRLKAYGYLIKFLVYKNSPKIKIINGEYEDTKRQDMDILLSDLLKYDVISFDIFDTLILRNVEKPSDIFKLVGIRQNISGFLQLRNHAEHSIREEGNSFYTIGDIYERLERNNGIDTKVCMEDEFEVELMLTEANPYIKRLYNQLLENGKKIILVSDMYWPQEYLEKLLNRCGYTGWEHIYISCDLKSDKASGTLYRYPNEDYSSESVVHIGDNYNSDVIMAKKHGIKAVHYNSVTNQGQPYRYSDVRAQSIGISVAHALINNEIHNGLTELNEYERYGYIYGGPLVAGYCHWINDTAKHRDIDKLLFLSRDADVIFQAYDKYYKEIDSEYVYASRSAVLLLSFERYPNLFIEKILKKQAVEYKKTIKAVLDENSLNCLLNKLSLVQLNENDNFDMDSLKKIENLIYKYKTTILNELQEMRQAAFSYWKNVIGDSKRVAFVDIELRGTIMLCLKYFLNEICHMDIEFYCFHLGTTRDGWNGQEFDNGHMLSYCFSSDFNKEWNDFFLYEIMRISVAELLFSSNEGTLFRYITKDDGKSGFVFDEQPEENKYMISNMHQGILDFVKKYRNIEDELQLYLNLSGESVIVPFLEITKSNKYIYKLFKNYKYCCTPGEKNSDKNMDHYFKENHYV